eukprot:scaffold21464_cov24-Prasinocladus_malaysianus.AAC.1
MAVPASYFVPILVRVLHTNCECVITCHPTTTVRGYEKRYYYEDEYTVYWTVVARWRTNASSTSMNRGTSTGSFLYSYGHSYHEAQSCFSYSYCPWPALRVR